MRAELREPPEVVVAAGSRVTIPDEHGTTTTDNASTESLTLNPWHHANAGIGPDGIRRCRCGCETIERPDALICSGSHAILWTPYDKEPTS